MNGETYFTFLITIIVLVCTPGASIMLAVYYSKLYGWQSSFYTALGDITANTIQIIIAVVITGTMSQFLPNIFVYVKYLGSAYLLYLVYRTLSSEQLWKGSNEKDIKPTRVFFFRNGFIVAMVNPQAIAFFSAIFPTFINYEVSVIKQTALLATTLIILDYLSVIVYSYASHKLNKLIESRAASKLLTFFIFFILIALYLKMLFF